MGTVSHVIKGGQRPTVYRLLKINGSKARKNRRKRKEKRRRRREPEVCYAFFLYTQRRREFASTHTRELPSAKTRNNNSSSSKNNRTLASRNTPISYWEMGSSDGLVGRRSTALLYPLVEMRVTECLYADKNATKRDERENLKSQFHFISAVAHP